MNTEIKTNKLKYEINIERITNSYCFYRIFTSEDYIKRGAIILDSVLMQDNVRAVKFESGKSMYVLMKNNQDNDSILKAFFRQTVDGVNLYYEKKSPKDVPDYIVLQLLLNGLGAYNSELLKTNNLTGRFYCFHPDWIRRGKNNKEDIIFQIPCLEFKITQSLFLEMSVRTFSSEYLRSKMTFRKMKFDDYPKYVLSVNNTLRRRLSKDREPCFILRQIDGRKTEIPFLDIADIDRYDRSKMGVLNRIVALFNAKYDGVACIGFETEIITSRIDYTKRYAKEENSIVKKILEEYGVRVVDMIKDPYSRIYCENLKNSILNKYGLDAEISMSVSKEKLNICLIHNQIYYSGNNDPHEKKLPGRAVQFITFEDFNDCSEFALASVIHEIIIKNDLRKRYISLYDWRKLEFNQAILFGMEFVIDDIKRYFFMKVAPDGQFDFVEQELDLFQFNEYTELVNIFEEAESCSEKIKGIVKMEDGTINIIKDTGIYTIPEIDKIGALLESGDNRLRGTARRNELMSSDLDIKMYESNDAYYYYAGVIGEGMRNKIRFASNIRKIEKYEDSPLMFDQLLPTMSVTFVHNGQLTVLPFPFKYLREYIATEMPH